MNVKALHLWYMDKRTEKRHRIIIRVGKADRIADMKIKISQKLDSIRSRVKYYYVVVEIRKPDQSSGFRTIVSQTYLAA